MREGVVTLRDGEENVEVFVLEGGVSTVMRKTVQDCVGGGKRIVPLQREAWQ